MSYTFGEADARLFYHGVLRPSPGEWIEVRAIQWVKPPKRGDCLPTGVESEEDFIKICAYWNGQRHVYAGVNPRKTRRGSKTGDVARIKVVPFDVDAPHPKETAATDAELEQARALKDRLVAWLAERGFSSPYIDFSGNGFRVALLVDLPATPENFDKVAHFHEEVNLAMGGVLDNISDPPRIIKVPGTWAIKGPNDPDRPHRLSKIIQLGEIAVNFSDATIKVKTSEIGAANVAKSVPSARAPEIAVLVNRMRPCFRRFINNGTRMSTISDRIHETALRLALVDEAYRAGIIERADLISLFSKADDFSEERTGYEIDRKLAQIKDKGAHPYGCLAISNHGGCIGPECQLYGQISTSETEKKTPTTQEIAKIGHAPSPGVLIPPTLRKEDVPKVSCKIEGGISTPDSGKCVKLTFEDVDDVLNMTIIRDVDNKRALFAGFLLNYTEEDQLNFAPVGPTCIGKTYLVSEVLSLFPEEDKIVLGYASSKAFYHEGGYYETLEGQPLEYLDDYVNRFLTPWLKDNPKPAKGSGAKDWTEAMRAQKSRIKGEWIKIPKTKVQDYHQKFLFFLDMPHTDLLGNLRPFLSHDKKRITAKITNKLSSGRNATETITLLGYPTFIFNTTMCTLDGQEQTRLIQLSPEIDPAKFSESISLISKKLSDRDAYRAALEADKKRNALKLLIQSIKLAGVKQIIVPKDIVALIEARFRETHAANQIKAEHQREYPRLIAYVKASALFNLNNRDKTAEGTLYATTEDVDAGFRLYTPFLESNESGMPPAIYKFWTDKLQPKLSRAKYLKRQEVSRLYYEMFNSNIGEKALKHLLSLYLNAGLIVEDTHPQHGSVKVITTSDIDMEELREQAIELRKEDARLEREDRKQERLTK